MNIFDTTGFVSRLHCGTGWSIGLVALDVLANSIIIIGYVITSMRMYQLYYYRGVDDIKDNITLLFVIFPICCGLSRIGDIAVYWWAPYRLFIILNWLCAFSALLLAHRLRFTLQTLFKYPRLKDQIDLNLKLTEEIGLRQRVQDQLQTNNQSLILTVGRLETLLQNELWIYDKKRALNELTTILEELKQKDE